MRKKIILLVTIIIVISSLISPVNAADNSSSPPAISSPDSFAIASFSYINYASCAISITSYGVATASSVMICDSTVDKIIISCYIQRYDDGWKTLHSWRETTYSNTASMSRSCYVYHGYTYRVRTYFYAYNGDIVESTYRTDSQYY